MGMPFTQPDNGHSQPIPCRGAEKSSVSQGHSKVQQVSITLDADCLCRLLARSELYVQDFSCVDASSKECVRQLLLRLLRETV